MSELSIFPVLSRFFKFIQVSHERDRLWVSLRRGGLFLGFVFVESVKAVTPGSCRIDVPSSAQSLSMGSSCGEGRASLMPAGHEICSVVTYQNILKGNLLLLFFYVGSEQMG